VKCQLLGLCAAVVLVGCSGGSPGDGGACGSALSSCVTNADCCGAYVCLQSLCLLPESGAGSTGAAPSSSGTAGCGLFHPCGSSAGTGIGTGTGTSAGGASTGGPAGPTGTGGGSSGGSSAGTSSAAGGLSSSGGIAETTGSSGGSSTGANSSSAGLSSSGGVSGTTGSSGGSTGGPTPDPTCEFSCAVDGNCLPGNACVYDPDGVNAYCAPDCSTATCPAGTSCLFEVGTDLGIAEVCYPTSGTCCPGGGAACEPASPCDLGATACAPDGGLVCVDTGNSVADGTSCGPGQECAGGSCGPASVLEWCNVQFPYQIPDQASAIPLPRAGETLTWPGNPAAIYARVHSPGVTTSLGNQALIWGDIGFGPVGSDPSANPAAWTWQPLTYNSTNCLNCGANYEYEINPIAPDAGVYDYAARFSGDGRQTYLYCSGGLGTDAGMGYDPGEAYVMTVAGQGCQPSGAACGVDGDCCGGTCQNSLCQ